MSSALNTAFYRRLAGVEVLTGRWLAAQQFLAATLGTDPDTSLPNVYKGNVNDAPQVKDVEGVLLPVITFRPSGGMPDHRFAHGLAVDDAIYDFEIWSWYRTANTITDIGEALGLLIDCRFDGPRMVLSSGAYAWCDPLVTVSELYDQDRNGWFGLGRYNVIEMRE